MRCPPEGHNCVGCGIPLTDGYVIGCTNCSDRRRSRLKDSHLVTPTGYAGEFIDNQDPRGRIVGQAVA